MKKFNYVTKFILFIFVLFTSCKSDSILEYEDENPEEPIVSDGNYFKYPTGLIRSKDSDWEGIPVLNSINELNIRRTVSGNKSLLGGTVVIDNLESLPRFDQGMAFSTCVSSSVCHSLALIYNRMKGMPYESDLYDYRMYDAQFTDSSGAVIKKVEYREGPRTFSVSFLHYYAVEPYTSDKKEIFYEGATIPAVFKVLNKKGIPTAYDWHYGQGGEPDNKAITKALFNRIDFSPVVNQELYGYKLGDNLKMIRDLVDMGYPVIFGMSLPENYPLLRDGKFIYTKKMFEEDKKKSEEHFIDHAMLIVGYDDIRQAYLVLSSWGEDWGLSYYKGCFWLSYDIVESNESILASDPNTGLIREYKIAYDYSVIIPNEEIKEKRVSKIYEFTGYQNYKGIEYENIKDSDIGYLKEKQATVKIERNSSIKYPMNTIISKKGTLEFYVNVEKLYTLSYLDSKFQSEEDNIGVIFSSFIGTQSESLVNQSGDTKGAFELRLNANGMMTVRIANRNYDSIDFNNINDPGSNFLFYTADAFKPGTGFHKIGISYGSKGLKVFIDGVLKINQPGITYDFSDSQKKFTLGHSLTVNNIKNKYQTYGGFTGYLKAFRTSDKEEDWIISKK